MRHRAQITDLQPPEHDDLQAQKRASANRWDAGDVVLNHLRRVQNEPSGSDLRPLMPPLVQEALLAWAISCYEEGDYADAGLLLKELIHRQVPSVQLLSAHAANLLALGDYEKSAAVYQKACSLEKPDPDLLVYWAQAEWCRGNSAFAHRLLQKAAPLFEKQPLPSQTSALFRELIERYGED